MTMPEIRVLWPGRAKPLTRPDLRDPLLFDAVVAVPTRADMTGESIFRDQGLVCVLHTDVAGATRWGVDAAICRPVFDAASFESGYLRLLAQCYRMGHAVNWRAVDADLPRQRPLLPTYPFRRRRYWIPVFEKKPAARPERPFSGQLQPSPSTEKRFDFVMRLAAAPELRDTHGVVHVGYVLEMIRRALVAVGHTLFYVREMRFDVALIVPEEDPIDVQLILKETDPGFDFAFFARPGAAVEWTRHIKGALDTTPVTERRVDRGLSPATIRRHLTGRMSGEGFYQSFEERGIRLGASVQWVDDIWLEEGEALAKFRLPAEKRQAADGFGFHAGIWDACAQLFHATLSPDVAKDSVFVVTTLGEIWFETQASVLAWPLWCHAWSNGRATAEGFLEGGFALYTDAGDVLAESRNVRMKEITAAYRKALAKATQVKSTDAKSGRRNETVLLEVKSARDKGKRLRLLETYLRERLSALLRLPVEELDITQSTLVLGLDSLIGLEFQQVVANELDVDLPLSLLLEGPPVEALAEEVLKRLVLEESPVVHNGHRDPLRKTNMNWDAWLPGTRKADAALRLYCFPYGNQSGAMYRNWVKAFPKDIEVLPVELPGRGARLKERPFESIQALVEMLTKVVGDDLEQPFAVFGHSVGALLGYAWCLHLDRAGRKLPQYLMVSAFTCPTMQNSVLVDFKRAYQEACGSQTLPSVDEVTNHANGNLVSGLVKAGQAAIGRMGPGGRFAAATEELFRAQLVNGVAALQLVDGFDPATIAPLLVPIAALHGDTDDQVSIEEMKAWAALTTRSFTCKTFPGNHVFIDPDQCEADVIREVVSLLLPGPGKLKR